MKDGLASVIIVNYNGREYLDGCLLSLSKQTYANYEIVIVDNNSTDLSVEFIEQNYLNRVSIVRNDKNYGFARGNNIGIMKAKGEYILTLNNDTLVDPRWIEELVKGANSAPNIGSCASMIYYADKPKIIDSVGMCIYRDGNSKQRGWKKVDVGQYKKQEEVLCPSACAALYKRRMLDDIGLFDEDFFAYCEDTDLGLRARAMGWTSVFIPSAIVYHFYSGTTSKYSALKMFMVERNHYWVVIKNYPFWCLFAVPFYSLVRFCVQISSLFNLDQRSLKKDKLLLCLIKAYWDLILRFPNVIRKRKNIKEKKTISNKEMSALLQRFCLKPSDLVLQD